MMVPNSPPQRPPAGLSRTLLWTASVLIGVGCNTGGAITPIVYRCGTTATPPDAIAGDASDCGDIDKILPPEPILPPSPTGNCLLTATRGTTDSNWIPDETNIDTSRIVAALAACPVVKLQAGGANGELNAFVSGPFAVNSQTLWIDSGVTLYASRDPLNFSTTGQGKATDCGKSGVNDSSACSSFITVNGTSPAIVGDGVIDGQGGELLVGHDYSWWQLSSALAQIDGSIGNPTMIDLKTGVTGFLMYRITLHNSAKFHVKITSTPAPAAFATPCTSPGQGFIVWGVTILTPSRWFNMQGLVMSPHLSRNTDGIDPGETSYATCGVLAHNTISTGDDHIAIKGGHGVNNIIVAHNHFGTGHGMSIGSETYGGVNNVTVCDLTIDADSRPVGNGASPGDFNGIRVKSDSSRGGVVTNVTFRNVCMRDVNNAILIDTAYNPLFSGMMYPRFGVLNFKNIHSVTCFGETTPVVTLNGFSPLYPAGPITLDNAIVDNIGPSAVEAEFSSIVTGPGPVNFGGYISGQDVTVSPLAVDTSVAPINCVFPQLPAPQPPPNWLN
jgi:polygalacturonase